MAADQKHTLSGRPVAAPTFFGADIRRGWGQRGLKTLIFGQNRKNYKNFTEIFAFLDTLCYTIQANYTNLGRKTTLLINERSFYYGAQVCLPVYGR
jgi:hypothetical protein